MKVIRNYKSRAIYKVKDDINAVTASKFKIPALTDETVTFLNIL